MAGPIRQQIDIPSLEKYIDQNVPDIKCPLEVKQFGYGQSNPTYQLTDTNGSKFVMRKRPPGKLMSQTAHRVDREYRILHALENTDVPAPKTQCFCGDENVVGTPFYIMEFVAGRIFEDPSLPDVSAEDRTEMWHDAVRTLGKFHRVPPASVNMSNFGKPKGFYDRQVKLFRTLSETQASTKDKDTQEPVGKIPHFNDMVEFFSQGKTQPADRGTFIHGDYKIDNIIFHPTEPRVIGILDWEMATIGHPLSDLTNLLAPWVTANNPVARSQFSSGGAGSKGAGSGGSSVNMAFTPDATPGLPKRETCIQWYAETVAGADSASGGEKTDVEGWSPNPTEMTWGDAFNAFKGSIIMQGIAARYAARQASSPRAMEYGRAMGPYAEVAWNLVELCREKMGGKSKL